jgi:hypothetical protein
VLRSCRSRCACALRLRLRLRRPGLRGRGRGRDDVRIQRTPFSSMRPHQGVRTRIGHVGRAFPHLHVIVVPIGSPSTTLRSPQPTARNLILLLVLRDRTQRARSDALRRRSRPRLRLIGRDTIRVARVKQGFVPVELRELGLWCQKVRRRRHQSGRGVDALICSPARREFASLRDGL